MRANRSAEFSGSLERRCPRHQSASCFLSLIRSCQPVSRADLARLSGLQRSTAVVDHRAAYAENWVIEGPTGRLPRGRRPTFLRLNDQRVIIGVDNPTGSNHDCSRDINGRFLSQEAFDTPPDPESAVTKLVAVFKRLMQAHSEKVFDGIGISLPGRFDIESQRLIFAPNLKWADVRLANPDRTRDPSRCRIRERRQCVCAVRSLVRTNRGNSRPGGCDRVGGNRLGNPDERPPGARRERNGGRVRPRGSLIRRGRSALAADADAGRCSPSNRAGRSLTITNRSRATGGPQFPDLLLLAEKGDPLAVKAFEKMARYLGRGLRMISAGLAPEVIVVVGEFTRLWHPLRPGHRSGGRAQTLAGRKPRVVPALEGQNARLRGTIALILQKTFRRRSRRLR